MNALLDTNLFYSYSQLEHSKISADKIRTALNQFNQVFISELSLLEMLAKYQNDHLKIVNAINFIAINSIKVHQILPDDETIAIKMNDQRMASDEYFINISSEAINRKIKIESDFITLWYASISSILLMFLFRLNSDLEEKQKSIILRQFNFMVESIKNENGYFQKKTIENLKYFYEENKSYLNDNLNDLLLEVVESINIVFEAGKNCIVFLQMVHDGDEQLPDQLKDIITKSEIAQRINRKYDGEKVSIIDNSYSPVLNDVINSFEKNTRNDIDKRLLAYDLSVYKKFLTLKDYKIKKNDIFDSVLIRYSKDYALLTLDSNLKKHLARIDNEKFQINERFIEKIV